MGISMGIRRSVLAGVLSAGLGAGAASAATLSATQSFDYAFAYAGSGYIGGDDGGFLPFAFFDAALGTLTGVRLSFASRHVATIEVGGSNQSPQESLTIQGNYTGEVGAQLLDPNLMYDTLLTELQSLFASCDAGFPSSCTGVDGLDRAIDAVVDVDPGRVALFVGAGTYSVQMYAYGQMFVESISTGGGSGTGDGSGSGRWSGTLSVDYDYLPAATAIPAPATPALVGLGLGLAGLARRARG